MEKVLAFLKNSGIRKFEIIQYVKDLGYKVAVIENEDFKNTNPLIDYVIHTDLKNLDKMITDLAIFKKEHMLDAVVTFEESHIIDAAKICEVLGLKGQRLTPVAHCRNKFLARAVMKKLGVPTPSFFLAKSEEDIVSKINTVGYPAIIKPLNLAGSIAVGRIDSFSDIHNVFENVTKIRQNLTVNKIKDTAPGYWIVEEYIDGFEVCVDGYAYNGETNIVAISEKLPFVEAPDYTEKVCITPSTRISNDIKQKLDEIIQKTLNAFSFRYGVFHIEARITKDGPFIVEINGRPGGAFIVDLVHQSTGVNLRKLHIRLCLGLEPDFDINSLSCKPTAFAIVRSDAGKIVKIDGIDKVKEIEGTICVEQWLKEGDIVTVSSAQYAVFSLISCDDYDQTLANAFKAWDTIKINVEPVG